MADTIEDAIRENATGPAQVTGDAGSVQQHPLSQQIEADRYLSQKAFAKQPHRALKLFKHIPPGTA